MLDLSKQTQTVIQILCDFIYNEITSRGFQRAVLGLSGGLDSALSCFLATRALGAENVLAVRMPYRTSSPDSLEDAQKVVDATGVQSLTIPITEMAEPLIERFPEMGNLRRGNILARLRMVALFDQSAAFNGLVIGSGNKSEILLGYSTLFGDSAYALNPLGDLYKTQVRQLAKELGVPASILSKAPSADLWQGQTDENEMGFTYEEVDRLLYLLVEEGFTPQQCVAEGFSSAFVEKVVKRVQRNQFKWTVPPICKVNRVTIGYEDLDPASWGEFS